MSITTMPSRSTNIATRGLRFAWLEITGKCPLECIHCYASSSPQGTHGNMGCEDWLRIIDQVADLGADMVQFIGGEPTLHRDLPRMIQHARAAGLEVEVYTNLVFIRQQLWEVFERHGVQLATSYYSPVAAEHEKVTTLKGSHARTRANIIEAVSRRIPLRVGVIGVLEGQQVHPAVTELVELGVDKDHIGVDFLRQVGRGIRAEEANPAQLSQLCGNCTSGTIAISPEGAVWPCVFSRWLAVGNVREETLDHILNGQTFSQVAGELDEFFAQRQNEYCNPEGLPKDGVHCQPKCAPTCNPCNPSQGCDPHNTPCEPDNHCKPG